MIEVLKQALEALQGSGYYDTTQQREAITAIKEAIREHAMYEVQRLGQEIEQEPVKLPCCGYTDASAVKWNPFNRVVQCHNCGQTYTNPPQRTWVGLTDEEKSALWAISRAGLPRYATYASLIEAKLKEKNS